MRMNKDEPASTNGFEKGKPSTQARNRAEAQIEELRGRGGVFVEAFARTRMPMVVTDSRLPGNPIVFANEAFLHLCGYTMEEVLGQGPHFMNGHTTDRQDAVDFRSALDRGEEVVVESVQYRKDGSRFVAAVFLSAIADDSGEITNHFLSYLDITWRVEKEQARREEARREGEERFRRIVENARDYAIFTTDPNGRIDEWYEGAEAVFGWSAEEIVGQPLDRTFTPEDIATGEPQKEMDQAAAEGSAPNVRWHVRKGGARVFIDGIATALHDADGQLIGFLKIGQDTTDRRRTDEHQRLLLAELQHRVRNIIAMIRSIARRTAETVDDVDDYVDHLEGRISAMARTQALLTRQVGQGVDLHNIVLDELAAQAAEPGRYQVHGPDVNLPPKAAEVLTLAIHELATNAVKYGALGQSGGRIEVAWCIEPPAEEGRPDWLRFTWTEYGVRVDEGPRRGGFGTELITARVPYELRGEGRMDLKETGVAAMIRFPLAGRAPSILQTDAVAEAAR